jgi:hypothetical protein
MSVREEPLGVSSTITSWFTWDYAERDSKIRQLYEKAKDAQWNARTDIDWSVPVEFGAPLQPGTLGAALRRTDDAPVPEELWPAYRWEYHAWLTSQFLHGEQGALLATARLVETVPDLEVKFYAASQVADEARHVEAYALYLDRLGHTYPINTSLCTMLNQIISDSRWDITFLGMQVIIEGIALALFRLGSTTAFDPVIRRITTLVARDEARHVAFGTLALDGYVQQLTAAERADREEFVKEAALLMCRRFRLEEVWERLGVDRRAGVDYATANPVMVEFRRLMFTRIVATLGRLGLLTEGVREHLADLSLMRAR